MSQHLEQTSSFPQTDCGTPETDGQTTIAARATAQGSGAIAIVRLSGPRSANLVRRIFVPSSPSFTDFEPWKLHHGHLTDLHGRLLDEVLCVCMPGPRSYTGEDTAEIFCHGSELIVSNVLQALFEAGATPARKGEFSFRAFVNGRMDLSQAEAVAEMIAAPSKEALAQSLRRLDGELGRRVQEVRSKLDMVRVHMSLAVDFPDDEVEILDRPDFLAHVNEARLALQHLLAGVARARLARNGARVVLAGAVNAGKSSLLNAILGTNRALVTDIPGTTRDFLEESVLLGDLPVRLVDTAGLRESSDTVEALGIARSLEQMAQAHCLVLVLDGAALAALGNDALHADTCPDPVARDVLASASGQTPLVVVWNKSDLAPLQGTDKGLLPRSSWPAWLARHTCCRALVCVSALEGRNVDVLCETLQQAILGDLPAGEQDIAPNDRQALSLENALAALDTLVRDIEAGQMYDLLSVHLDTCCACLDECMGVGSTEDVLNKVFENFCIGK